MEISKLKKFAQFARRSLMEQVSAKLKLVLAESSAARRESAEAIKKLDAAIKNHGKEQVIERVAYIWFNRFCALRFMDVNRYTRIGVVSPAEGQFQPEILAEAKMGHIDEEMVSDKTWQQIFALLEGKAPSRDPQGEAYRLLVVGACNDWHRAMPFLFERIADYTELLMPDDLISGNSILAYTREAMTPDACEDVEVIGWLYQFYISEKKDEVFDGLKKNKKITPENIPAATQLFTPHWIVRYLVENSLGRLWMLNRPGSKLVERMNYYIEPEQSETDFLRIAKPDEIKICDPACGSGHMLTYAFDLLYAIYEEDGYEPAEIPEKILTHNLYGIEIDERAGELAAFALTMKARAKQRRFFSKGVNPNICVLQNVRFEQREIEEYMDFVGRDLFTAPLQTTLRQFEEVDNFGSLIRPDVTEVGGMLEILETKDVSGHLFLNLTHQKVLQVLRQADYLSPKYHVVIANPPYMGASNANARLKSWLKDKYVDVKSDLFSAFIIRNTELTQPKGHLGFMSPFVWMFIASYEKLRTFLINHKTITSLVQLEYSGFDGATVPICTFTVENAHHPTVKGSYIRLSNFRGSESQAPRTLEAIKNPKCGWFYRASALDFIKIPGKPVSYWVPENGYAVFDKKIPLGMVAETRKGMVTARNHVYVRHWYEVDLNKIGFGINCREEAKLSRRKWFPYIKGGEFRRWYGNKREVVNWENDGFLLQTTMHPTEQRVWATNFNLDYIFKPNLNWSDVTSGALSARVSNGGGLFDATGLSCFPNSNELLKLLGFMNSRVTSYFLTVINPTMHYQAGNIAALPAPDKHFPYESAIVRKCIDSEKLDWNSFETSWDFTNLPLLRPDYRQQTLKASYQNLRAHWREMTLEMQRLEDENNRIFIEAYGLQDELKPDVPLDEITLTCNPHYRYGVEECEVGSEKWEEMEARLLQDTMKELISYAIGCMFGRYSLDMPGLVLANQGESVSDYYRKIEEYRANERKELSGVDRLAEGDGFGGNDLSGDATISEGGVVRTHQSDLPGSSINTLQHRGGPSEAIDSEVQKLFVNSARLQGGSRNSTDDRSAAGLSSTTESRANSESLGGDQTHDLLPNSEAALSTVGSEKWEAGSPVDDNSCHSPLPTPHFSPDEDNVIPILDGDWFPDDIAERFRKFLRVAFGEEHYEENLRFVEQALNIKCKRNYSIRDYFLGEFYTDHVKRYKKRPIYWLFSSPKGSFNALIYMHRYRPDTVSVVLNDYLREFRTKLTSHKNHLQTVSISATASQGEKTKALKEIEKINKMIAEMEEYEREVLYPLATEQVPINLDDGVKVNYPKFGAALKKIPGLDASED